MNKSNDLLIYKNSEGNIIAESEYEKYRVIQDQKYVSTIDEFYNKYLEENKGDNHE